MGTTVKYPLKTRLKESNDNPTYEDDDASYSAVRRERLRDPVGRLTRRLDVGLKGPAPVRLPLVDEFDFEEACRAKDLARKFRPPSPEPDPAPAPWTFPYRRGTTGHSLNEDERYADWQDLPPPPKRATRRAGKRGILWGLCASVVILLGAPAVFGIVQPLSGPPQERASGVSAESGDDLANLSPPAVDIAEAEGDADLDHAAPIAPATTAVSTAQAATTIQQKTVVDGFDILEPAEPPATVAQALDLRAAGQGAGKFELASPPPRTISAATPDTGNDAPPVVDLPQAEGPAASALQGSAAVATDRPLPDAAGEQLADTADDPPADTADRPPAETVVTPLANTADEPLEEPLAETREGSRPDATESVASPLSPAEIERLLARAEEMLRNGQIASARLLFSRIAAAGDRRGAKGMGMTYDPKVYERLSVTGVTPDSEQAAIWYEKAGEDATFTIDLTPPDAVQAAQAADAPEELETGSPEWNAACAKKYRSFEPDTGLYTSYGGTKRQCDLP